MITHRIYKRPFNPANENAKDIRVLVAQFTKSGEAECNLLLHHLQKLSTSFDSNVFSNFRYTLQVEPEPCKRSPFASLQIDADGARPTNRPITFTLSWDKLHDKCRIIAVSKLHGTIRAEIPDEPAERSRFVRQIKQVWPNAKLAK